MKTLASIALWVVIAMSPQALEAFSEITGAQILSGTMDLQPQGRMIIRAEGEAHGITWDILTAWAGGMPQIILSSQVKVRI